MSSQAEDCEYTAHFYSLKDLCGRDLLPFDLELFVEAVEMKTVQLLGMPLIYNPGLIFIQDGEDIGFVDPQFGRKAHSLRSHTDEDKHPKSWLGYSSIRKKRCCLAS